MTVTSTTRRAGAYACDGSTQDFTFSFACSTEADLKVILTDSSGDETELTLTTHYTVSSAHENDADDFTSGGTVTTVAQYASGNTITIERETVQTQATDLPDTNQLGSVEDALDKLTCMVQDVGTQYNASVTWDAASIANGAEEAKEVTVTGASLGDFAVASLSIDIADLQLSADVTATDTVTCVLSNSTGSAVNLASATLYVRVFKR